MQSPPKIFFLSVCFFCFCYAIYQRMSIQLFVHCRYANILEFLDPPKFNCDQFGRFSQFFSLSRTDNKSDLTTCWYRTVVVSLSQRKGNFISPFRDVAISFPLFLNIKDLIDGRLRFNISCFNIARNIHVSA